MYRVAIYNGDNITVINDLDPKSPDRIFNANVTAGINEIGNFTFSILPFNSGYNLLHELTTKIMVFNDSEIIFAGRIFKFSDFMTAKGVFYKVVVCTDKQIYLTDTIQPYKVFENTEVVDYLAYILGVHNENVTPDKHIVLGDVNIQSTEEKTNQYRTTFEEIKENLLSKLGGEIRIRTVGGVNYLDYLSRIGGQVADTKIELTRNLQDLNINDDPENIITRLIPLGKKLEGDTSERLTVATENGGRIYIDDKDAIDRYGIKMGTQTWDEIENPAELLEKGTEFLAENNKMKRSLKLTALDLSKIGLDLSSFEVGNEYQLLNPVMGVDEWVRVVRKTLDINKPYKSSLEIGDKFEPLSSLTARNFNRIESEIPRVIQSANDTAREVVTNSGFITEQKLPGLMSGLDVGSSEVGGVDLAAIITDINERLAIGGL